MLHEMQCVCVCVCVCVEVVRLCCMLMRGFITRQVKLCGARQPSHSPWSNLLSLRVFRLVMLQCSGLSCALDESTCSQALIWSLHRGNQVKVNPDRRSANVLSPPALHEIACDEYIQYPPTPSRSAVQAACSLSLHIMKVWLERYFFLCYSLLTAGSV